MKQTLKSFGCLCLIAGSSLAAEPKASHLEDVLTRALILHHAGAFHDSRLLYEEAFDLVDQEAQGALITPSRRISVRREAPDGVANDEGIAPAIAEELDASDGILAADQKLREGVIKAQKDILLYNIGSTLLSEGQPEQALDLWSQSAWSKSPAPWLTRRLCWNAGVAFIEQSNHLDTSSAEGQLETLRSLHRAAHMFVRTLQADCIWHHALSSTPCTPTSKLQEAMQWTQRRFFAVQNDFRNFWIARSSPLDLIGAILATFKRFEDSNGTLDCTNTLNHMAPLLRALQQFPSLHLSLNTILTEYRAACLKPFDLKRLKDLREELQQKGMQFKDPLYLNKESRHIRLLYAQGLAEWGNLLYAYEAAQRHRTLLGGSEEGQRAMQTAAQGAAAFEKGQFELARSYWQLTCFWMDEQMALLDHLPQLEETADRLLNRHLWTQYYATHLLLLAKDIDEIPQLEALTQLVQSTLGTAAFLFSLARDMQLHAFEANHCSRIAWEKALPLISHGELFMQGALQALHTQSIPPLSKILQVSRALSQSYPFWLEGALALRKTSEEAQQSVQEIPQESSSSIESTSLKQRTLRLQEMQSLDQPSTAQPPPPFKEAYPW